MPQTPSKVGQQIDLIIGQLNAHWDLQIDRIHGSVANKAAGNSNSLARKCASLIRALCWKNGPIHGVIKDFEERAAQIHSHWVYKPGQAQGTLPSLPTGRSFLKRDAIAAAATRSSAVERSARLSLLSGLLDEEWKLVTESEDYRRTSFKSASANTSFQSTASNDEETKSAKLENHYSSSKTMTKPMSLTASNAKSAASAKPSTPVNATTKSLRSSTSSNSIKREASETLISATSPKKAKAEKRQLTLSQTARRQSTRSSLHETSFDFANPITPLPFTNASNGVPTALTTSFDSEKPPSVFSEHCLDISSNDTSFYSDSGVGDPSESQFSGGTQLDLDYLNDPGLKRSFDLASALQVSAAELLENLPFTGPFRPRGQHLPENTPFWYAFELHRLALHLDKEVGTVAFQIQQRLNTADLNFEKYWEVVRSLCKEASLPLLQKSKLAECTTASNQYEESGSGRSTYFSARLTLPEDKKSLGTNLFDLQLMPAEMETSCRFHRKWGPDRFMVLNIPVLAPRHPSALPHSITSKFSPRKVHEKVFSWIAKTDLHIAGRVWRAFYVEPKSSKNRKKSSGPRLNVHLFATSGIGLTEVSLLEFVQWHCPWVSNLDSTDLKLFARMHLGLSRTTATVELDQSEFIEVPDKKGLKIEGSDQKVMSDGCARISHRLADAIWQQMGRSGPLPSAFQARIGGAKGLWVVDYHESYRDRHDRRGRGFWIEISDSQLKIKPHPVRRSDADQYQRTFEVVKVSRPCKPTALNIQVISILENRGVSRRVLGELTLDELQNYYDELTAALSDSDQANALRAWRQNYHPTRSDIGDVPWCGHTPNDTEDELDMLLEAGFKPEVGSHVRDLLRFLIKHYIQRRKEKLWIQVPQSTNVFCVPDFSGVLAEGEVQLNLSEPISGISELENRDALVVRNPAHLPSDIQKVRLVHHASLRWFKNVILFSTQGSIPLADKLSGGDYDGDTVSVFFDKRLTEKFENAPLPTPLSKTSCGIVSETRSIKSYLVRSTLNSTALDNWIEKCSSFNGIGNPLGEVTKFLEKLDYQDSLNKNTPDAALLAALAGWLVDAPKQGDSLDLARWNSIRYAIGKRYKIRRDPPAYDGDDHAQCLREKQTQACSNVVDHLKFEVSEAKGEEVLTHFCESGSFQPVKDQDLCQVWEKAQAWARSLKGDEKKANLALLEDLKKQIAPILARWAKDNNERRFLEEQGRLPESSQEYRSYSNSLEAAFLEIVSIVPLDNGTIPRLEFERYGNGYGRSWSLLRASCVYATTWRSTFPWKVIGRELALLKTFARSDEGHGMRVMDNNTRNYMKFNTKKWAAHVVKRDESEVNGVDDDDYGTEA